MKLSSKPVQRTRVVCCVALLQYLVFAAAGISAAEERQFTVEDLLGLETIVSARISPNEHSAAIVKLRSSRAGEHFERYHLRGVDRADIWLLSEKGSNNLTDGRPSQSGWWAPLWSPSGDKIAALSTESQADITLYIIDASTGEKRRVSDFGVNLDLNVDGRLLRLHGPPYQWLNNNKILVSFRKSGVPDGYFASGLNAISYQQQRWADMAGGKVSSASILSSKRDDRLGRQNRADHFLAVVNTRTMQMRTLTTGEIHKVSVSHNRRKLAVALAENSKIPPLGHIEFPPEHGGFGLDSLITNRRIAIIDIPSGKITKLPRKINPVVYPSQEKQMQWSFDDETLAILYKDELATEAGGKVALFNIKTSRIENISGSEYVDRLYWCGDSLFYRSGSGWRQWIMNLGGRAQTPELNNSAGEIIQTNQTVFGVNPENVVLFGDDCNPERVEVLETGPGAFKNVQDETDLGILVFESKSKDQLIILHPNGIQTKINSPCRYFDVLAVARDGLGAFLQCSEESGDSIFYANESGYREILRFNEHISHVSKPFIRTIQYNALGGQQLSALLIFPSNVEKHRPFPMIVDIYPGRMVNQVPAKYRSTILFRNSWLNRMQYVSAGYAVLMPSLPWPITGTNSFNTIDIVGNGVLPAIDKAVSLGFADKEQIGLRGHSYGGYAAYSLLTRTNIFKAAVVSDATSDLISDYLQSTPTNRALNKSPEARFAGFFEIETWMGGPLWDNYDNFVYNSPIRSLPSVTTPILILHGERDGIPLGQAEEYFYGLTRLGKEAQLVTYWGEAHNLKSPANIRDAWHRTEEWFDQYLRADLKEPD